VVVHDNVKRASFGYHFNQELNLGPGDLKPQLLTLTRVLRFPLAPRAEPQAPAKPTYPTRIPTLGTKNQPTDRDR
jgi:hypothetical protein